MGIVNSIIKRFPALRKDVHDFGLYIALTNMLWPVIVHFPVYMFNLIMDKKNRLVIQFLEKKMASVIVKYKDAQNSAKYSADAPIWVCWLQGEEQLPDLCKICLKSIRKFSNRHPVFFLSLKNYKEYVELPTYIEEKYHSGMIGQAHFADILRTVLLAEHGGCWIDMSILLTDNIKEDIFQFPFYSCKFKPDCRYITNNIWSNFFIAAQKGGVTFPFVRDMFYEYLKVENRFIDYFMMDYIIRIGFNSINAIRTEIDVFPTNNTKVHELMRVMREDLNIDLLNDLFEDTYIHKLNWRIRPSNYPLNTNGGYVFNSMT